MTELRRNILTGEWVVIASGRAMRPESFSSDQKKQTRDHLRSCPFCVGNEGQTPPELFALRQPETRPDQLGWRVRVVPNKFPAFSNQRALLKAANKFLYPSEPGNGHHEVIIHGPDHNRDIAEMSVNDFLMVLSVYQKRLAALAKDKSVLSSLIIVNQGREAGASIEHPHSQLFGIPLIAPKIEREMDHIAEFTIEHGACLICAMIAQEKEEGTRVVAENSHFLAFCPFASSSPFEVYVMPKNHQAEFNQAGEDHLKLLSAMVRDLMKRIKEKLGEIPYNMFLHTRPFATGDRDYHWHIVILPKISTMAGFEFGTDIMINIMEPEAAAEFLRG